MLITTPNDIFEVLLIAHNITFGLSLSAYLRRPTFIYLKFKLQSQNYYYYYIYECYMVFCISFFNKNLIIKNKDNKL